MALKLSKIFPWRESRRKRRVQPSVEGVGLDVDCERAQTRNKITIVYLLTSLFYRNNWAGFFFFWETFQA